MKTTHTVSSAGDDFDTNAIRAFPRFEPADYLDSEEAIVGFVNIFSEEGDATMLAHALATVARAPGVAEIAQSSASTREGLCTALCAESRPHLDTIMRVMTSLGLRLVVEPINRPVEAEVPGSPPGDQV
ncbi:addiction module antidote protein [Massilia violaceinigra]|nr:addiction module antidote protein [Massilia violaceinigra]